MSRITIRYCTYLVSRFHAARVAARIRKDLRQDVDMVSGHYGEFKVLVDGKPAAQAGVLGFLGVLPSAREVLEAVRAKLAG